MIVTLLLLAAILQQQSPADPAKDLAAISARLGPCSADFTVSGTDSAPVYAATIHVRIRYGFMNLKRMDLEVGTGPEGRARVEGLPEKARPLVYDISGGQTTTVVEQDLSKVCNGTFAVTLK